MKTYIIGAGASKCYEKSPTGLKMPVAKEFFQTYNKLRISSDPNVLVGHIINYVGEYYNISPEEFIDFNRDIEELHSEVEEKLNISLETNDEVNKMLFYSTYNQLVFLFTSVINEIQNGEISFAHKELIASMEDTDSIITFNWDTLIDRALHENGRWNCDNGYLIKPKMIYRDKWEFNNANDSKIKLIKLHGSTNWLSSYTTFNMDGDITFTHDSGKEIFYVYEYTNNPYSCYKGRYLPNYKPFSYGYYPPNLPEKGISAPKGRTFVNYMIRTPFTPKGTSNDSGLVSMPLIIPPVKNKKYTFYGDLFPELWNYAEMVLVNSDTIIILGYSFPKTDIRTNELFISAFTKRNNIPDIIIVNPNPELIYEKFKLEFGIPEKKIKIYKERIDENYDFKKLS